MGILLAQLAATITAALKRRAIAYALWAASGLLMIFAAGFALNALHTVLMFRWGSITASLVVAGGLLLSGIALALVGHFISRTSQKSLYQRLQASPEMSITAKRFAGPSARRALASAGAGALAGGVAVFTLAKLRGTSAARIENEDSRRLAASARFPDRQP